jgi:integrase/recombinase XerD
MHNLSAARPPHRLSVVPSIEDTTGEPSMEDDDVLELWMDNLRSTGSTPDSISTRVIALRALRRRTDTPFTSITRHQLIKDLGRELAPSTRVNYKSLYHTFFTWMQDEQLRADNPGARLPKTQTVKTEPNPVTTKQIEKVLASGIYAKARLQVLLYAYQGFRCVEIAAVSSGSIDWDQKRIQSREAKGGYIVWRPIHPIVWAELQKWRHIDGWLFPSPTRPGRHVTPNNVSRVISEAFRRCDIVGHTAHDLRAWFATELIDAGVPTIVTSKAMRHQDLQSIEKYALVRETTIAEAMLLLPTVTVPERSGRKRAA